MGNLKIQGGECGGRNNTHQHEYLKSSYLKFESGEISPPPPPLSAGSAR